MIKKLSLLLALMAITVCSCSKDDAGTPDATMYDIVTYLASNRETGESTFVFRRIDDSPQILLTAKWLPGDNIKDGQRILLGYTSETPGESGPVEVRLAQPVIGGEPIADENPSTGNLCVSPVSIWRSGYYLNMRLNIVMSPGTISARLLLDEATAESDCPVYYLSFTQTDVESVETRMREAYCSWNIRGQWNLSQTRSVKVIYRGVNDVKGEFTLLKTEN